MSGYKTIIGGLTWNVSYGCYRAKVAGWLELTIEFRGGGYYANFPGVTLKEKKFETAEGAALALIGYASSRVAAALTELSGK